MTAATPVLAFEHVTYGYPGAERPQLVDVSLSVAAGEFVVLAGASASGKSTLLRAACGLVPHFAGGSFAGRVTVCGDDSRDHPPAELSRWAGMLAQDPETQVVMTTVRAELAFPLENAGEPPGSIARGVEEVALALGIGGLLDRSTSELSGGELQRVALAATLVRRPRLVLLDEPTSQLDPVAGDELIWLLRRLNEEWGTTVVLAEHRLERCLPAADRVVVLDHGRVVCDEEPAAFLAWAADASPALCSPIAAMWHGAALTPLPAGVKDGRRDLAARGLVLDDASRRPAAEPSPPRRRLRRRRGDERPAALAFEGVWHEIAHGPTLLRSVDLRIAAGERVALMGRNGAGKSTLLRHAAGLLEPTRGRIRSEGRVALLLQDPGAYLLHERVGDEASLDALEQVGLAGHVDAHPSSLSGGQRQRLALAIVLDGEPATTIALDEPTRGMDRADKQALAERLGGFAEEGRAVIVATHDPEFAARACERVVLLAGGRVIADGPVADVLAGGWYFAPEVARVSGGRALLPEQGAELLRDLVTERSPGAVA